MPVGGVGAVAVLRGQNDPEKQKKVIDQWNYNRSHPSSFDKGFNNTLNMVGGGLAHTVASAAKFAYEISPMTRLGVGIYHNWDEITKGHYATAMGGIGSDIARSYGNAVNNSASVIFHGGLNMLETPQRLYRYAMLNYHQGGWEQLAGSITPMIGLAIASAMTGGTAGAAGTEGLLAGEAGALAGETAAAGTAASEAAATAEAGAAAATDAGAGVAAEEAAAGATTRTVAQQMLRGKYEATRDFYRNAADRVMATPAGTVARAVGHVVKMRPVMVTNRGLAGAQIPYDLGYSDPEQMGELWQQALDSKALDKVGLPGDFGSFTSKMLTGSTETPLKGITNTILGFTSTPFMLGRALKPVAPTLHAVDSVAVDTAFNKSSQYRAALNEIIKIADGKHNIPLEDLAGAITRAFPTLEPIAKDLADVAKYEGSTAYDLSKRIGELADLGTYVDGMKVPTLGLYGAIKTYGKLSGGKLPSYFSRVLGQSPMAVDDVKKAITTLSIRIGEKNAGWKLGQILQQTGMRSEDITRLVNHLVTTNDVSEWEGAIKTAMKENFFQRIDRSLLKDAGLDTEEFRIAFRKGELNDSQIAQLNAAMNEHGLEDFYHNLRGSISRAVDDFVGDSAAGKSGLFSLDSMGNDISKIGPEGNRAAAVTENQRGELHLPNFKKFDKEVADLIKTYKGGMSGSAKLSRTAMSVPHFTTGIIDDWVNTRFFKPLALLTPGWATRVALSELILNTVRLGPLNMLAGRIHAGLAKAENRASRASAYHAGKMIAGLQEKADGLRSEIDAMQRAVEDRAGINADKIDMARGRDKYPAGYDPMSTRVPSMEDIATKQQELKALEDHLAWLKSPAGTTPEEAAAKSMEQPDPAFEEAAARHDSTLNLTVSKNLSLDDKRFIEARDHWWTEFKNVPRVQAAVKDIVEKNKFGTSGKYSDKDVFAAKELLKAIDNPAHSMHLSGDAVHYRGMSDADGKIAANFEVGKKVEMFLSAFSPDKDVAASYATRGHWGPRPEDYENLGPNHVIIKTVGGVRGAKISSGGLGGLDPESVMGGEFRVVSKETNKTGAVEITLQQTKPLTSASQDAPGRVTRLLTDAEKEAGYAPFENSQLISDFLRSKGYGVDPTKIQNLEMIMRGVMSGARHLGLIGIGKKEFLQYGAYLLDRHSVTPAAVNAVHKSNFTTIDDDAQYFEVPKTSTVTIKGPDGEKMKVDLEKTTRRGQLKTKMVLMSPKDFSMVAFGQKRYFEGWAYGAHTLMGSQIGRPVAAAYLKLYREGLRGEELHQAAVTEAKKVLESAPEDIRKSMARDTESRDVHQELDPIDSWANTLVDRVESIAAPAHGAQLTAEEAARGLKAVAGDPNVHERLLEDIATGNLPDHVNEFYERYAFDKTDKVMGREFFPDKVITRTPRLNDKISFVQRLSSAGHSKVLGPIVNYMVRQPTYINEFVMARKSLDAAVRRGSITADQADVLAESSAMKNMVKYIHNPDDKTKFEQTISWAAPFYFAQNQAWRRAGRLFAENPGAFMQYFYAMTELQGMVNSVQDQNGMSILTIPSIMLTGLSPTLATSSLATIDPFFQPAGTGEGKVQTILDLFAPKFNPVVTISAKEFFALLPRVENFLGTGHFEDTAAGRMTERNIEGQIASQETMGQVLYQAANPNSFARNLIQIALGATVGKKMTGQNPLAVFDGQFVQTQIEVARHDVTKMRQDYWNYLDTKDAEKKLNHGKNIDYATKIELYHTWEAKHLDTTTESGLGSVQKIIDDANAKALLLWVLKVTVGSFSPSTVGFSRADLPIFNDFQKFAAQPKYKNNYKQALDDYEFEHPWATAEFVSSSKIKGAKIPTTKEAMSWYEANQGLVTRYPYAAAALSPDFSGGKTGYQPMNALATRMGLRTKDTPFSFLEQVSIADGNNYYYNFIRPVYNALKDAGISSKVAFKWKNDLVTSYGNYNPLWLSSFQAGGSSTNKQVALRQFMDMTAPQNVKSINPTQEQMATIEFLRSLHDLVIGRNNDGLLYQMRNNVRSGKISSEDARNSWHDTFDTFIKENPEYKQGIMTLYYNLL